MEVSDSSPAYLSTPECTQFFNPLEKSEKRDAAEVSNAVAEPKRAKRRATKASARPLLAIADKKNV